MILHRRNRALVEGRTGHLRVDPEEWVWFTIWIFAFVVAFWVGVRTGGSAGAVLALLSLAIVVGLSALTAIGFRERSRRQRKGRLLTGQVTSVDEAWVKVDDYGTRSFAWSRRLRIAYRFLTPAGEERADAVMALPPRGRRPRPVPGDQLAVLYVERSRHVLSRLAPRSASPGKNLLEAVGARWRLNGSGVAPAGYDAFYKADHQVM